MAQIVITNSLRIGVPQGCGLVGYSPTRGGGGSFEVDRSEQHREQIERQPGVRKDLDVGAAHAAPSSARISIVTMAKRTIISAIKR